MLLQKGSVYFCFHAKTSQNTPEQWLVLGRVWRRNVNNVYTAYVCRMLSANTTSCAFIREFNDKGEQIYNDGSVVGHRTLLANLPKKEQVKPKQHLYYDHIKKEWYARKTLQEVNALLTYAGPVIVES